MDNLFNPGDKVCYFPTGGQSIHQNGIVKSITEDGNHAFVVYSCCNDWENYMDYTGARTPISRLEPGWFDINKHYYE